MAAPLPRLHASDGGWLFTRGTQSVRLVREEETPQHVSLNVYGPESDSVSHHFGDLASCIKRQAEIEQLLLAEGYQLVQPKADRRVDPGVWEGTDHRRPAP